jgi:hypothetical protein
MNNLFLVNNNTHCGNFFYCTREQMIPGFLFRGITGLPSSIIFSSHCRAVKIPILVKYMKNPDSLPCIPVWQIYNIPQIIFRIIPEELVGEGENV